MIGNYSLAFILLLVATCGGILAVWVTSILNPMDSLRFSGDLSATG